MPYRRRPLLANDIVLKTCDGLYRCRKGTDDVDHVVSERGTMHYVRTHIRKGVFIDVGAHIGLYTVMAGGLLTGKGKVLAIEPDPSNYKALKSNVVLNKLEGIVTSINVAAWSEQGEALLNLAPPDSTSAWSTLIYWNLSLVGKYIIK